MSTSKRLICLLYAFTASWSGASQAQEAYPAKPVRIVVPYPAGGAVDTVARLLGTNIGGQFGQSVIVDNKPGASGAIAQGDVVRAPADGHTLLADYLGSLVLPSVVAKNSPVNPMRDLAPVATVASQPLFLAVRSSLGVNSVADLVKLAKSRPGKLSFGSPGIGTESHLVMEQFKQAAGLFMVHIPYKGGVPAAVDMQGGVIEAMAITWTVLRPGVEKGQLKILATFSASRVQGLETIPTMAEAGHPTATHVPVTVLMAPAKTPQTVIKRWQEALSKAKSDPAFLKWAASTGSEIMVGDGDTVADRMQSDVRKWSQLVPKLDLTQ